MMYGREEWLPMRCGTRDSWRPRRTFALFNFLQAGQHVLPLRDSGDLCTDAHEIGPKFEAVGVAAHEHHDQLVGQQLPSRVELVETNLFLWLSPCLVRDASVSDCPQAHEYDIRA
jgi:hypothetical protein